MAFDTVQYNIQYAKENKKRIAFDLNKKTDADILEYFDTLSNVNGYLKQLIRDDMKRKAEQKGE